VATAAVPANARSDKGAALSVGFIGYGYWGPNLVRNFSEVGGASIKTISDLRPERLAQVGARYPATATTTDSEALIADPAVDAVVIMSPVSTHFDFALKALEAGKHVLVGRPLATSAAQAAQLVKEAARRRLVLMVDHTLVYTGAARRIKELVDSGTLGQLYYYDSVRVNLGLFQHDLSVLWDLAIHDLSMMDYILGRYPRAVSATGAAHFRGHQVNIAYLTCFFDDGLMTHHHVNWLAPVKIRRTLVGGSLQMIVYDDLEPSEKVRVYDKGVTVSDSSERVYESLVGYRSGDMWSPQLSLAEGLKVEAHHFLECIRHSKQPLTDGESALRVISILEAATQSLMQEGQPVKLPAELNPNRRAGRG
jgi:predicted dehydrogenase